ncbi:MAG: hypothetical protein ACUVTZ_04800, partial [Armatimonadota bacterium]
MPVIRTIIPAFAALLSMYPTASGSAAHREALVPKPRPYRVAIHSAPGASSLASALVRRGFSASVLTSEELSSDRLTLQAFDVLVFPDGRRCPIGARDAILAFLRAGGDMLVVGGPLFESTIQEAEAKWRKALEGATIASRIVDPEADDPASWTRSSNNPDSHTSWTYERTGPPEAPRALKMDIGDLTGWDTLGRTVSAPFPSGAPLTVFWAKGDSNTTSFQVEWREKDGSRWIATVPLTTRWKRYFLPPDRFAYWPDSRSIGRGGTGDCFRPENAEYLAVGLAMSHGSHTRGRHVFWLAALSSARLPDGARAPDTAVPVLEM